MKVCINDEEVARASRLRMVWRRRPAFASDGGDAAGTPSPDGGDAAGTPSPDGGDAAGTP